MHCSIIDLARFAALHVQGARGRSRFLRPETFRRLQTAVPPGDLRAGLGDRASRVVQGPVLAHKGSNGQNYAVCRVAPAGGFAVCVMTNLGGEEAEATCESVLAWLDRPDPARAIRPTTAASPPGRFHRVPMYPWKASLREKSTTGFGQVRVNKTADDTPLQLDGMTYSHGIGVHANSELLYERKPEYQRFVAQVGIDDKQTWHGTVVVKVYAGTKLLLESGVVRGGDSPWSIDVPLTKGDGGPTATPG